MKKQLFFALTGLLAFTGTAKGQELPCVQLRLYVEDGESETAIPSATILDIGSNEMVVTDSEGHADFASLYSPDTEHTFQVFAPGYPDTYRKVRIAGIEPGSTCGFAVSYSFTFSLASEKLYLSPPVGPGGGERVIWHPTGQQIYADESYTGTPQEYLQRIKVIVPAGSLSSQYRIGLTPYRDNSFNNAFMETFSTNEMIPQAQFRIGLYDLSGNPVPSPTFNPPIRLEISPAVVTPWTDVEAGIGIGFIHFDESTLTWDQSGVVNSGLLLAKGSAFVELEHFSVYEMCIMEPRAPVCWWELVATYALPCASPNGAILDTNTVVCGVGGTGHEPICVSTGQDMTLDTSVDTEIDAGMVNKLKNLGFHVTLGTENSKSVGFNKSVSVCRTLPNGSDPVTYSVEVQVLDDNGDPIPILDGNGDPELDANGNPRYETERKPGSGTVVLRELLTRWLWDKYCTGQSGVVGHETFSRVTGLCVDTTGLTPCP